MRQPEGGHRAGRVGEVLRCHAAAERTYAEGGVFGVVGGVGEAVGGRVPLLAAATGTSIDGGVAYWAARF